MEVKRITKYVLRGPQPKTAEDLTELHGEYGVRTIINLQEGWSYWPGEERLWQLLGGKYIHYGLSNFFPPTYDEVRAIIRDAKEAVLDTGPVYIHCKKGVDRTGFVAGAYEVYYALKTVDQAWDDMQKIGMHWWFSHILWRKSSFQKVCDKLLSEK